MTVKLRSCKSDGRLFSSTSTCSRRLRSQKPTKCVTIIIQTTLSFTFQHNGGGGGGGTKEISRIGLNLFLDMMSSASDSKVKDRRAP